MKYQAVRDAVSEAKRFIRVADEACKAHDKTNDDRGGELHYSNPVENGALRRASMDLTRTLARMRKS